MNYTRLAIGAFVVLWKLETIPVINRLRLWRKTINLFVCFLAFTDRSRPYTQLRGAMLSAILSALYDYETDWIPIESLEDSLYLCFLKQGAGGSSAYTLAHNLFIADCTDNLSDDGLERGSIALAFYHSLIGSKWMRQYSDEEIALSGRKLQIIDDLLDREEDRREGDKNCLLTEKAETYLQELREFLGSDFFRKLAECSPVYRKFERDFRRVLGERVPLNLRELAQVTRPLTGVFAFVLTCLGFKLAQAGLLPASIFGATFAGITASIMVFNDLCDSARDVLKGKRIAHDYALQMSSFYQNLVAGTGTLLTFGFILDWRSGLLAGCVWGFGLLYSLLHLRFPVNNLLVALCSGAPVLTGILYTGKYEARPVFLFLVIFAIIAISELFKDIEDAPTDRGYKDTLALRVGADKAALCGARLGVYPLLLAVCCPNTFIQLIPCGFMFVLPFVYLGIEYTRQAYGIRAPNKYSWVERAVDLFLTMYITAFWFV